MEQNNLFKNRYLLVRLLGKGGFSEVWLANDTKTNIRVALKIYAPSTGLDDSGLDVFAREFSLVVNANHKNLLKPLYYDSYKRQPFLVLPYCQKGSIKGEIGKMSEKDAWRLLRDVASGLAWLHNMNPPVVHQDIKPDNILIGDNGDFMITDFGVSTRLRATLRKSISSALSSAGTIAYMAPERFSKDNTPIMGNDIYSLGATVFEMLTGDAPFGDDGGLYQMKGAAVPELKGGFSSQMKKVIARCLRTNPWDRPTAEQLEKWADDGLHGRKISFKDNKSIGKKYRTAIVASILSLLTVGGVMLYHFLQPDIVQIKPNKERMFEEALLLMNSNDKDILLLGIHHMDSLCNMDYIPALYEMAFTYGWYSDSLSLKRKKLLDIEILETEKSKYMPVNDEYNTKAMHLLQRIVELEDSSYASINAYATYRLACYYNVENKLFKQNVDKCIDLLNRSEEWANFAGDSALLSKVYDYKKMMYEYKEKNDKYNSQQNY